MSDLATREALEEAILKETGLLQTVGGMAGIEDRRKPGYDFFEWLEQRGVLEQRVFSLLVRKYRMFFLQQHGQVPTNRVAKSIDRLRRNHRIGATTQDPWLPLDFCGPFPIMAHYAPMAQDRLGFHAMACFHVLVPRKLWLRVFQTFPEDFWLPNADKVEPLPEPIRIEDYPHQPCFDELPNYECQDGTRISATQAAEMLSQEQMSFIPLTGLIPQSKIPHQSLEAPFRDAGNKVALISALETEFFVITDNITGLFALRDGISQSWDKPQYPMVVAAYAPTSVIKNLSQTHVIEDMPKQPEDTDGLKWLNGKPSDIYRYDSSQEDVNPETVLLYYLYLAQKERASDLHLEQDGVAYRIRRRVDGILEEIGRLSLSFAPRLLTTIRSLCSLRIEERRAIQDGRFMVRIGDEKIDARVSLVPTVSGIESCVMRLTLSNSLRVTIDSLRLPRSQAKMLYEHIALPEGMIIMTGPTGCGKTSTLYAILDELNRPGINILTIENPVERVISGIKQFQVLELPNNEDRNLTFAKLLTASLRQDPDVIMVGEIRDEKTAITAVKAALSGHQVFTTMHTNDAIGVINRLRTLGVDSDYIGQAVRLATAQRLVRRLCSCMRAVKPTEEDKQQFVKNGIACPEEVYEPTGCEICRQRGYRGRQQVMQMIPIDRTMQSLIESGSSSTKMMDHAERELKVSSLYAEALHLVARGITSMEEARSIRYDLVTV